MKWLANAKDWTNLRYETTAHGYGKYIDRYNRRFLAQLCGQRHDMRDVSKGFQRMVLGQLPLDAIMDVLQYVAGGGAGHEIKKKRILSPFALYL